VGLQRGRKFEGGRELKDRDLHRDREGKAPGRKRGKGEKSSKI